MIDLGDWTPRQPPGLVVLEGERVQVEPFVAAAHLDDLFATLGGPRNAALWHWMTSGPFFEAEALGQWLARVRENDDGRTLVIRSNTSREVLGMASYLRLRTTHGSVELGSVAFGDRLRRTTAATEALALMAQHVFDTLGYRRYEWKCDANHTASRRAAERFGFSFEGIFRNDMVTKGRSRDTAWYSLTDAEWPRCRRALKLFLASDNFDSAGRQITPLEQLRRRESSRVGEPIS